MLLSLDCSSTTNLKGWHRCHYFTTGVGKIGTDEGEFNRILSSYSYPLLRVVFDEYKKIKGKSFGDALEAELSGDLKLGMKAVCK